MPQLRVQLFGPLTVSIDQQSFHTHEFLASLWWGDQELSRARCCLNTTLRRLREVLESKLPGLTPFVISEADMIGFNATSDYWLDVAEFERLCTETRQLEGADDETLAESLRRAVTQYRGDLLPGCYDEWCLVQRQRLQQMYLAALSRLAGSYTRRHEIEAAIGCYNQILVYDPVREDIHRQVIRLYMSARLPQAALHQFQQWGSSRYPWGIIHRCAGYVRRRQAAHEDTLKRVNTRERCCKAPT